MATRRQLRRQLADLQQRYERVVEKRDEAQKELDSRQWIEQNIKASHDDLVITRTRQLDSAKRQLTQAEDELADLRKRLADQPTPSQELRDARRELMLLRRQTAELTARLELMQKANEAAYRQGAFGGPAVTP